MAIQISEIKLVPNPLIAGRKAKVTCKVTADAGVESVQVYDPRGWLLTMYDDGTHGDEVAEDGVYTLEETVPYDADAGTYYATLIVKDKSGNVKRESVKFQIA